MNFVPRLLRADCAEAVVLLPDSRVEITFRCISRATVVASTVIEVSRMKECASLRSMPLLSATRLQAAREAAVRAIAANRENHAQRQRERFNKPFQLLLRLF